MENQVEKIKSRKLAVFGPQTQSFSSQTILKWFVMQKIVFGGQNCQFATFYFFRLKFRVKSEPKWAKNRDFSILDKSAKSADMNDL